MFTFSNLKKALFKISILLIFISLAGCNTDSNNNDAYINVSIAGNNQTKTNISAPAYAQDNSNVNILPAGITRVDFTITDSNDVVSTKSLPVGAKTQTIRLRVKPNRNLIIDIEALTGDTVSFRGQSTVSALRPGQSFPLRVSLNQIGTPPNDLVTLSINPKTMSQYEGDNGASNTITFEVKLSSRANGTVTANYTARDITAIFDNDYVTTESTLTIPAGQLTTTISVLISGDNLVEDDEAFEIILSNASANVTLGNASAAGLIISDDHPGRLNDTGVTLCGDYSIALDVQNSNTTSTNSVSCSLSSTSQTVSGWDADDDPIPLSQDAHYGRDVSNDDDSDGLAGFSYTKLDADGFPLADQTQDYATQPWSCVKDNYTGLTWEVKTTSGLQNNASLYDWINTSGTNDGGAPGDISDAAVCSNGTGCDIESYVTDMNTANSCGAQNWRMPTVSELLSIVNNSQLNPAIDTNYFPNTQPTGEYWTSSSLADLNLTTLVWTIISANGQATAITKYGRVTYVRLVHAEPIALP